ncbi:MAG: lipid-transfer protein [Mycobacteriales bacterium]|nr:lipid-transfer protein [Mycobacteriales bacterium]
MGRAFVVGVGMTDFVKPGSRDWTYPDMVLEAGQQALGDAGISYDQVQQAAVGWCAGDSTASQRAVYGLGLTGIPVYNVNNNCATGSTALFMAEQFVRGGVSDVVMAIGFEKMQKGPIAHSGGSVPHPMDRHIDALVAQRGFAEAPVTAQFFGNAAREHMDRYGSTPEMFAAVAEKNHRHSVDNPRAQFRDRYTLAEIMESRMIHDPLTKLQCSPTSDGAAAAVVVSERFVEEHGLRAQAVEIAAMAMVTDTPRTFEGSDIELVGAEMSRRAGRAVFEASGLGPEDVDVIELHDCFSANEVLTYEALGLCAEGKGGVLAMDGATTHGGQWVVNPSGGLISKGHPLGATGVAQCAELVWQLRGQADARQVPGATVGLQHNIGLGGAVVVAAYRSPSA